MAQFATRKRVVVATLSLAAKHFADTLRDYKTANRYSARDLSGLKNPLTAQGIADIVGVSVGFVEKWTNHDPLDPEHNFERIPGGGQKRKLASPEAQALLTDNSAKRFASSNRVAQELKSRDIADISISTVRRERFRMGFKPFKHFRVLFFTALAIAARLALVAYCTAWNATQWGRWAFCDEFFIWTVRRQNSQNHRILAQSREEVADVLAC